MRKTLYFGLLIIFVSIALILTVASSRYNEKSMKEVELLIVNETQKYNIDVIGPSDSRFYAVLDEYLGEYKSFTPLVQTAKPFALFIKNDSDHEIIGVSLRWKFLKTTGEVSEVPQIEVNPGVLIGLKPLDPFMIGKTSIVNRGTVRFFSYFVMSTQQEVLQANMRSRNPNVFYPGETTPSEIVSINEHVTSQKLKLLNSISSITVFVDGIFFENGTFVGKDENFFFDFMRGQIQARRDLLNQVAASMRAGKTDKEILSTLLHQIPEPRRNKIAEEAGLESSEKSYEKGYKSSLKSMRKELERQRANMSDSLTLRSFQSTKEVNFIPLQKLD